MADYKSYLAASILTDDKVVTYRLLSRVFKVHVNAAKEMLFDFHRTQNAKKAGTIHATYLIFGTKKQEAPVTSNGEPKDGDDDYMQSSPFMSSMPITQPDDVAEIIPVLSVVLGREEDLEKIKPNFEHISSIQIYSLGPNPLKDLQLLSDSTREIRTLCASEDPLESYTQYGIITNPNVKRRARKAAAPIPVPEPATVPTRSAPPKSKLNDVQEPSKSAPQSSKPETKSQPSNAKDFFGSKGKEKGKAKPKVETGSEVSSTESTPAPPATLKKESSSLFKAFAKTQPRKVKKETTDSGAEASAKEDTPMKDVSDDEEEDNWAPAPDKKEKSTRASRKEKEAALRKMMDDDDEDEAVPSPAAETPVEEGVEEENDEPKETKEDTPPVTTSNGRRRGRRRVMKKKTVKDEDGYLVTKQEQAWESFSEDEPAPAPKPKAQPTSSNTSKPKKGAAGAKTGQGNIMSFFGKKSS